MVTRKKLAVKHVDVVNAQDGTGIVTIVFSRHLNPLEVSGVKAVLEGQIQ